MAAAVRVVKRHVQEERPSLSSACLLLLVLLFVLLQKLPDQQLDAGDVASHLQHRAVLLRVGEVEGVHGARPHVLLPDDASTTTTDNLSPNLFICY